VATEAPVSTAEPVPQPSQQSVQQPAPPRHRTPAQRGCVGVVDHARQSAASQNVRVVLEHLPSLNNTWFKWLDEARLVKSIRQTFNVPTDSNGRTCSIYPTDDPRSIRRGHIDLPRHASDSIAAQLAAGGTLKLIVGPKDNPKVISRFPNRSCCSHVRVHQHPRTCNTCNQHQW
jgi:hypothetical protein